MLEAVTGRTRLDLLTEPGSRVEPAQRERLATWIAERASGTPLQHLTGVAPFWGLALEAGPDALVPRPETERLVELVLEAMVGRTRPTVLDLGTGSGAIAIAIAIERPDAEVWASELDPRATELAARNLARFATGVRLVQADLLQDEALHDLLPRLDALVANLPYLHDADADALPPEVKRDPAAALFGGSDGLELLRRAWLQAEQGLFDRAEAWFELDPRNVAHAAAWLRGRPALEGRQIDVLHDLTDRPRFLRVGARNTEASWWRWA